MLYKSLQPSPHLHHPMHEHAVLESWDASTRIQPAGRRHILSEMNYRYHVPRTIGGAQRVDGYSGPFKPPPGMIDQPLSLLVYHRLIIFPKVERIGFVMKMKLCMALHVCVCNGNWKLVPKLIKRMKNRHRSSDRSITP